MPKNTQFNQCWLLKTDSEGIKLNLWLKPGGKKSTFRCIICKTDDLDCSNQGWGAISQHMKTKGHLENMKLLRTNSTFSFQSSTNQPSSNDNDIATSEVRLENLRKPLVLNFHEQVLKAEALWALTVAQRGYSFNSCDEIGDVFRNMFPDSKIAHEFSIQSKKISYVLSHGLGPYFHQDLVKCLKRNEKFVLCFDEQTNNQNRKQLDLLVRYWCHDKGLVVTRYYKSIFLGHATASILKNAIVDSFKTDGLEIKRLLMLGRDSPFVNLSLEKLIQDEMKKNGGDLLKIGGCHLHVVHNGFKAGLSSTDWHPQNKCIDIYSWFKQSPARKQDFIDIIDDFNSLMEKTILYFTNTRWVLLGKVINRVLVLWEPLNEYFLVFLPTNQKQQIQKNDRYDRIKLSLTSYKTKIQLQFVLFLCETIFDRFLTLFQQEAPLIHLLHLELSTLYRGVLVQFLVPEYVGDKTGGDLLDLDFTLNEKQLNNTQICIGEGARKLLVHLDRNERESFFVDVKTIYQTIAEYLKKHLPLKSSFLRDIQVLNPSFKSAQYTDEVLRIARAIPYLLTDQEIDYIRDEWLTYSLDIIDEKWYIKQKKEDNSGNEYVVYHRIDYYWNKVLGITTIDGRLKYPTLNKLIKNALIIPHGNADIERGFSINEHMIPQNRSSLSDSSINGIRSVYDGVKFAGAGSSHKVHINKDIIKSVEKSYQLYKNDLNLRKSMVERSEKENTECSQVYEICKQVLIEEAELLKQQKDLQGELQQINLIIVDGTESLNLAIKKKDSFDMDRASTLIGGATARCKMITEQLSKVTEELIKIQKKRKEKFGEQQQKRQKTTMNSSILVNQS
ncbi:unnamed protein product [Rotaria magnacalcarata]|uniref:Uncharacterized protein n=1 Tax=Rotaria magnacalcarata TaxID=392030 RepID=A0A820F4A1_9BILA|nr:unnamed protein product [Rotaria magnacalcarata]CAF4255503.1 unnamed protein product [Rotaria magnacalcarata]